MERDQVEYVVTFSLSMLATSFSYFLSLERPATFAVLVLIPLLFGFTAYSSREGFRTTSLLAMVSLIFAPLRPGMAAVALIISLGNPMISVFASGSSFKDFYGVVAVPMLIVAAALGGTSYIAFEQDPSLKQPIQERAVEVVSGQTEQIINETGLADSQTRVVVQTANSSSRAAILRTQRLVFNSTGGELSFEEQTELSRDFEDARETVPQEIASRAENRTEDVDVSSRIRDTTGRILDSNPSIISGGIGLTAYGLHPVVGLLTAIFASLVAAVAPESY